MRVTRLALRNFKPYRDADIELRDGVTVVHGVNGSGKSSLLEACFFALYGSAAIDGTLEDVVTNGEDECTIEFEFAHDGREYRIVRELKRTGDRVATRSCVLEGPDLTIDGARDVESFVTDLLRMDAAAFLNCAYVRQGEVNKLINATPTERQDMIDDLLQLGRLEEYRDRAAQARLGVEDVLSNVEGALQNVEAQIADAEAEHPYERLNSLETELNEVDEEIDHYESQRSAAETALEEAESILSSYRETREELESIEESIEELETEIAATERDREELRSKIVSRRERIDEIESTVETLRSELGIDATDGEALSSVRSELESERSDLVEAKNDARVELTGYTNQSEALEEKADRLESEADALESEADSLEAEAASSESELETRREKRAELQTELESLRSSFEDEPVAYGEAADYLEEQRSALQAATERKADLDARIDSLAEDIEETEALIEAGNCPECGQPIEGSPHVHAIEDERAELDALKTERESVHAEIETLRERIERAESLTEAESRIDELETTVGLLEERIDEIETTIETRREEAEAKRTEADAKRTEAESIRTDAERKSEEAAAARETITAYDDRLEAIDDRLDRLTSLEAERERIEELESAIDRFQEKRESLEARNEDRRDWLADRRTERDEIAASIDDEAVDHARDRKENAERHIEQFDAKLDALAERRDDLTGAIGGVRADIEALESLRDRRADLRDRVSALETAHEEAAGLESMYGDLRASLRQQNVETLERMLNETFDLVYQNDAYARIELDGEYELSVYQKDGEALDPEQLSGGERALFNLSLRCAIYRLLAEGIDGSAPTPPLILDEPTVFLDSGHVTRLIDLVAEMRGLGVEQILIVSHDEELIAAGDELVTVEKNPTTNRSSLTRRPAPAASAIGND